MPQRVTYLVPFKTLNCMQMILQPQIIRLLSPPAFGGARPSRPASAAPQNSNNNLMAMLQALFGDKSQSSSNIYANQSNILPNNMAGQGQIPYGGKPLS